MDLDLNDTESSLRDSIRALLERRAGPARAKALAETQDTDRVLAEALQSAGFLDLFGEDDAGPSAAGLVTEWVAEAAGVVSVGARTLVAPAVVGQDQLPLQIAVAEADTSAPVRFGADADALLVIGVDEASLLAAGDWDAAPVQSKYGYPAARVAPRAPGVALGPGSADRARRWWQAAIAAEITGTAAAAVDLTVKYVKEREQFGRPIGAFQALQHRLVECAVQVEGVRWLTREAIAFEAAAGPAAAAAVAATEAARLVTQEMHQITGAMGFTLEYDLHVWSLRLQSLRVEAGGIGRHAEALVTSRWG